MDMFIVCVFMGLVLFRLACQHELIVILCCDQEGMELNKTCVWAEKNLEFKNNDIGVNIC